MNYIDWIGSIGVFLILLAYFFTITRKISTNDLSFIVMNIIGSAMACLASFLLGYWPFIILEGVWCLVSIYALTKYKNLV